MLDEIRKKFKLKSLKEKLKTEIDRYYTTNLNDEEAEYLKIVSNYIEYYNYRAWTCKWLFYGFSCVKIVALAGVTFVNALNVVNDISVIAVLSTTLCLVIEGMLALFRLQEKWILYRNTDNVLLSEVRQYISGEGKYSGLEERFSAFVKNVESIIGEEARKWNDTVVEREKKQNADTKEVTENKETN